METNPLFNAFQSLVTLFGRKLRGDVFVASYGTNELRFYTDDVEEPELLGTFSIATTTQEQDLELFREVTESI